MFTSSIRQFLLIHLLIAIVITTTLTAIGNYYLDEKDIQEHLDTLMAVSALSSLALLGDDVHQRPLDKIQQQMEQIAVKKPNDHHHQFLNHGSLADYLNRYNFQVWTDDNRLLLHSSSHPKSFFNVKTNGFSNQTRNGEQWRLFSTSNPKVGIRTVLAERYDTRNELEHRIAQDDLYIMLLIFPLSGLLIWIIIGRGLDSLDKVATELSNRVPTYLEPLDLEEVPKEIKPVVDELNQLFFRLKEGFEREKRFAADAAHELRTPLAALKAQAQVALNANSLQEKNQALHKLIASVNRSTHIVQQLLTLSRLVPEAGNLQEADMVNIAKLTRDTLAMLAPAAVEKQIELELDAEAKLPKIHGNATALEILVRNLVDNAIRYSNEGGRVLVRLLKENKQIILEVSDNGPGIPEELRARVFERFFRVLGNKSPGSGLGLAIVEQICELHGGRVELDAPLEGSGLIVKVFLPI